MFEISLRCKEEILYIVYSKCINCKIETGLYSKTSLSWVFDKVITKLVLNAIFRHVVMLCIISSNKEMKYDMDKDNNQDCLNKGPWYNTSICL